MPSDAEKEGLDFFLLLRKYFEPSFEGLDIKLTELSNKIEKYSEELYNRTDKQERRIIQLEERQVGNTKCIERRDICKEDIDKKIEDFFNNNELVRWARRVRKSTNHLVIVFSGSALLSILGWLLYIFKSH